MAILHGSWISDSQQGLAQSSSDSASPNAGGYFLIWGEVWRRVEPMEIEAAIDPQVPEHQASEDLP
ncbi:hypothetical protein C7B76_30975, partial [filamentous cyanobacterium CCP2]